MLFTALLDGINRNPGRVNEPPISDFSKLSLKTRPSTHQHARYLSPNPPATLSSNPMPPSSNIPNMLLNTPRKLAGLLSPLRTYLGTPRTPATPGGMPGGPPDTPFTVSPARQTRPATLNPRKRLRSQMNAPITPTRPTKRRNLATAPRNVRSQNVLRKERSLQSLERSSFYDGSSFANLVRESEEVQVGRQAQAFGNEEDIFFKELKKLATTKRQVSAGEADDEAPGNGGRNSLDSPFAMKESSADTVESGAHERYQAGMFSAGGEDVEEEAEEGGEGNQARLPTPSRTAARRARRAERKVEADEIKAEGSSGNEGTATNQREIFAEQRAAAAEWERGLLEQRLEAMHQEAEIRRVQEKDHVAQLAARVDALDRDLRQAMAEKKVAEQIDALRQDTLRAKQAAEQAAQAQRLLDEERWTRIRAVEEERQARLEADRRARLLQEELERSARAEKERERRMQEELQHMRNQDLEQLRARMQQEYAQLEQDRLRAANLVESARQEQAAALYAHYQQLLQAEAELQHKAEQVDEEFKRRAEELYACAWEIHQQKLNDMFLQQQQQQQQQRQQPSTVDPDASMRNPSFYTSNMDASMYSVDWDASMYTAPPLSRQSTPVPDDFRQQPRPQQQPQPQPQYQPPPPPQPQHQPQPQPQYQPPPPAPQAPPAQPTPPPPPPPPPAPPVDVPRPSNIDGFCKWYKERFTYFKQNSKTMNFPSFQSILWPTLNEVVIPSDITKAEVCRFIEAWPEKRQDSLIKQHLLVWHPDRSSHYLSRVSPALRNDVQEACRSVTQILVGIMDDRRAKAEQ